MCGIVGVICISSEVRIDAESIKSGAELLKRRGPNDSGIWIGARAGFGHRRLAVIDTSSAGHQPMTSPDKRYVLVFNGEIYNYRALRDEMGNSYPWQGHSDSEVVLAAYIHWGSDCLSRFHGMFAFAIWDTENQTLFAARDRMGVKPFYYHHSPERFVFASRPRALHALIDRNTLKPDMQALRYYLECGYIPAPHAFHEGVQKLPPSHYLSVKGDRLSVKRYWDFNHITPAASWEARDEQELLDELDGIVSRCVRSRMVSDVPLGAFLSGGIDSALVVALMSRYSSLPVKTFTIGFDDKEHDESRDAQAVADYLGTEHSCNILGLDDLRALMPDFIEEFDEPFYDSSALPTMALSKLARTQVTVSLTGDGGDELFGGYPYYRIAKMLGPLYSAPAPLRHFLGRIIGVPSSHRFRLLSCAMLQDSPAASFAFTRSIAKDFGSVLHNGVLHTTNGYRDLLSDAAAEMSHTLHSCEVGMRLDSTFTLPDDYLQKVDVASMRFSLECREPLLDQTLVEWAMKLPLKWKIHNGVGKYLLRKLAYRYLPEDLLARPKRGFTVPIDKWLRGPLRDWALERLNDNGLYSYLPIDKSKVMQLFQLHDRGTRNVHPLLWALLMLVEYCNQHERL